MVKVLVHHHHNKSRDLAIFCPLASQTQRYYLVGLNSSDPWKILHFHLLDAIRYFDVGPHEHFLIELAEEIMIGELIYIKSTIFSAELITLSDNVSSRDQRNFCFGNKIVFNQ
jgi:hypothetical protein